MENQQPWNTAKKEREDSQKQQPWNTARVAREQNEEGPAVKSQFFRSYLQGLTDYSADEAEAFVMSNLPDSITGNPQTYQQARDKIRNDLAVYKQASGGKAFGMEMLGALTQGVLTSIATRNPRAAFESPMKAFQRNALQGARAGIGESEADLMEGDIAGVTKDTAKGAGYGLAIGRPFEKMLSGAGKTFSRYGSEFLEDFTKRGKTVNALAEKLNISYPAANIMFNMLGQGMNLQQMTANLRKAGDQGMIIDADKSIAQLGDAIQASGAPNAGRIIGDAAETRAANQADELRPTMDQVLGEPPEGLDTAVDAVASRTAKGREKAYSEAYAEPIDYASGAGLKIESLINDLSRNAPREFRSAIQSANLNMAADGKQNMQFLAEELADGTFKVKQMPNMIQLDYLKQALQATYDRTGDIGYKKFSEQLRDAGVEAVPKYGKALQLGQAKIVETEVMQMGAKFLQDNVKLDQLKNAVKNASNVEMDALRLGARNQIEEILDQTRKNMGSVGDDKAGATAEESRKLLRILSSDSSRNKLRLILGDAEAQTLFTKLDEVQSGLQLLNSLSANSATAMRVQLKNTLDDLMSPGILGTVARGDLQLAPKQIIQTLTQQTPEAIAGRTDDILSEVATVLTQARGKEAEAALQLLAQARQGTKLSTAQAAFVNKAYEKIKFGLQRGIQQGANQQIIESDPAQHLYN
jgi:hypothetical protein